MAELKSGSALGGSTITLKGAAVIEGYDLRGRQLVVEANNVIVRDCLFDSRVEWNVIDQRPGFSGLVVEHCSFVGGGKAGNLKLSSWVWGRVGAGPLTVRRCQFLDGAADAIQVHGGGIVEQNYFSGSGFGAGSHADSIWIGTVPAGRNVVVRGNYFDMQIKSGMEAAEGGMPNNGVRLTSEMGPISGPVTIESNIFIGYANTISIRGSQSIARGNFIHGWKWSAKYPNGEGQWENNKTLAGQVISADNKLSGATQAFWIPPLRPVQSLTSMPPTSFDGSVGEPPPDPDPDPPPVREWANTAFPSKDGLFVAEFDATPSQSGQDAVIGLSMMPAASFQDLACIVKFAPSGRIEARDADDYRAIADAPYEGGRTYRFEMVVDVPAKLYSVRVMSSDRPPVLIADDFKFRMEQADASALANLARYALSGAVTVSDFSIRAADPPPPQGVTFTAEGVLTKRADGSGYGVSLVIPQSAFDDLE